MTVSVIVVNHNRADFLHESLRSLAGQTCRPLEILVVDNASHDHSREVAASFDRVRLIPLDRNLGFAAANNVAIRQARGRYVALLNNDAVADPGWLAALTGAALSSPPRVGMWASKILFSGTNIIDKAGHLLYPDGQNRGRGTGEEDRGQFARAEETFFPDGCAALYRRRLLEEMGGFDESFFAYADDADLGVRAQWLGWSCLYVPGAVVRHRHSSTVGRFSAQKVYWVERNRLWLAVKNLPLPLLLVSPLFTLYRWFWNLVAALLGRGPTGGFRSRASLGELFRTLFRAYRDGVAGLGRALRQRRRIVENRRISTLEFYRLLVRFRISARVLALQEARLPEGQAGSCDPSHQ